MDKKLKKKEYKFFQNSGIFYAILVSLLLPSFALIVMIIYSLRIGKLFGSTIVLITLILFILYFTISKFSNKIILSKEGIIVQHFKKQIVLLKWNELENASIKMKYNTRYISLKIIDSKTDTQGKSIEFNISNRKLSHLRRLCTNNELKEILDNIKLNNFFRYY